MENRIDRRVKEIGFLCDKSARHWDDKFIVTPRKTNECPLKISGWIGCISY